MARPNSAKADGTPEDLSDEIASTVDRWPGDQVRCTHISGSHYRCNWWSVDPGMDVGRHGLPILAITTHKVRRSQFLRVERAQRGLNIEVLSTSDQ